MEKTIYFCKVCKAEVIIKNSVIIKTCEHKTDSIIAELKAVVYGISSIK